MKRFITNRMKRSILVGGNTYTVKIIEKLLSPPWEFSIRPAIDFLPNSWLSMHGFRSLLESLRAKALHNVWGMLVPDRLLSIMYGLGRQIVMHWIGTDVLEAMSVPGYKAIAKSKFIQDIHHWAVSPRLVSELKSIGIKADYMPIVPPDGNTDIMPLPERFSVLCYLPDERLEFYGASIIYRLAEEFSQITFSIVGTQGKGNPQRQNIQYLAWVSDMKEVYRNATVIIRPIKHDGLPLMVLEALAHGRYVIWTYPMPGVFQATDYITIKQYLEEAYRRHMKKQLNIEGRNYYEKQFDPSIVREKLMHGFRNIINKNG